MYSIIRLISSFIRDNMLPNPFESLGDKIDVNLFGIVISLSPDLLMFLVESLILGTVTYFIVGLYYRRRSAPALGSFLYLLFYCVHIGLMFIMGKFAFSKTACIITLVLYVMFHIILLLIKHFGSFPIRRKIR